MTPPPRNARPIWIAPCGSSSRRSTRIGPSQVRRRRCVRRLVKRRAVKRSALRRQLHHAHEEVVDLADHGNEALEVHRLGDVGVGVQLVAAQDVLLGLRRGEHHDRDLAQRRVLLDLRQHLAAVDPGQVQIQQDQVGYGRVGVLTLVPQIRQSRDTVVDDGQPVPQLVLLERLLVHEDLDGNGLRWNLGHVAYSSADVSTGRSTGPAATGAGSTGSAAGSTGSAARGGGAGAAAGSAKGAGSSDGAGAGWGRVNTTRVPSGYPVSIQIWPPWYSTIFLAIARPIPVPG